MSSQKRFAISTAIAAISAAESQDVCRALVLSGGASLGAWEAGILYGLAEYSETKSDYYYDVTTGISAGAINTAGIAGFAPNELMESAQFLSDTWSGLVNEEIWQTWDEGFLMGCLTEHGCLDDSPALNFLDETLKKFPDGYKRRVTLASGNANNGEFTTFDQTNTDFSELHQAALASGSIPGVFPPQLYKNAVFVDGGTIYDVNVISAVEQCLEIVDDMSKIIIDIAICSPEKDKSFDPKKDAAIDFLLSRELRRSFHSMNSIQWQKAAYPDVNYRHLFYDEVTIPVLSLLDFRNVTTWPMQVQGRA